MPKELEYEWVIYGWQLHNNSNPKPIAQIRNNPIVLAGPGSLWAFRKIGNDFPHLLKLTEDWEELIRYTGLGTRKVYYACENDIFMFMGDTRIIEQKRCHRFMFVRRQEGTDEISFGWAEEDQCCQILIPAEET